MLQEISASKPDFSIILGNFNARSKVLWNSDINTNRGTKIDVVTSSYGLQQLIFKQHICQQTPFLMLTSFILTSPDWYLIVEPIHLFIKTVIIRLFLANQIFKLLILYPIRIVSGIAKNSILILHSIQKAIKIVEWYFMFMNKTVHQQVITFNTILMNVF